MLLLGLTGADQRAHRAGGRVLDLGHIDSASRWGRCVAYVGSAQGRCTAQARSPGSGRRDVGRADAVTVGDGGQSLDVPAEQPGEGLRSRPRTAAGTARRRGRPGSGAGTAARRRRRPDRGRVAVAGQRAGQGLGRRRSPARRRPISCASAASTSSIRARRTGSRRPGPRPRRQELHGPDGQLVVRGVEVRCGPRRSGRRPWPGDRDRGSRRPAARGRSAAPGRAARRGAGERPAAVRPSRSASWAAVDGPCSRMERATRSRVEASASRRPPPAASALFFTTRLCAYSPNAFKQGQPYREYLQVHDPVPGSNDLLGGRSSDATKESK